MKKVKINSPKRVHRYGVLAREVRLVVDGDFPPPSGGEELLAAAARDHLLCYGPRRRLDSSVLGVRGVVGYVFYHGVEGDDALLLQGRWVDQRVEDVGHRADESFPDLVGPFRRGR